MASKETSIGVMFLTLFAISLVLNVTFIVVICRRHRLHNGHYVLMSTVAVVDIVMGGTWTCLSGAVTLIGWTMPQEMCRLQSYTLTLVQMLTAFLLAAVAVERCLRLVKPSRHAMIFVPRPIAFIIFALVMFCGVISSIHLYDTLSVKWLPEARQCGAAFTESIPMLNFTFCLDHAIPYWVIALPVTVASFLKLVLARRKPTLIGEIILETNLTVPGDSYSSRLANIQAKFNSSNLKGRNKTKRVLKKPNLGKLLYTRCGYTEPEHWDSDIDDGEDKAFGTHENGPQKIYILPRPEYVLLVSSALTIFLTSLLWLPWVVARFMWNCTPLDSPQAWFGVFAVTTMHLASCTKLIVYTIFNSYFRSSLVKTFCCGRNVLTN